MNNNYLYSRGVLKYARMVEHMSRSFLVACVCQCLIISCRYQSLGATLRCTEQSVTQTQSTVIIRSHFIRPIFVAY
ncbi:hypothetical protein EYC80_005048 [Monilinia laxa]|uniref:Uncharacterized protein n=1 Tax=Monilinia laxa TaxID=61186 RepID=A0A5N6KIR1_MONLA|nr:hypothetical protein EYC80_005048 [Monilinia laxa]